jgi:signal transduction histidine kinase
LLNSYFLRVGTIGFGIALLVAFFLGFMLIVMLTKGIRKIQSSVQLFGEGNYNARIDIKGNDEMAQLAGTINTMANTILQNITDLKQIDGLRRELIANVSHDLRSPLTVIHGYVETYLMKKDSLSEEDQKKYLEAILVNSERLTKLVADLFELSKLEAKQVTACREPMALNEMLVDLTKQFSIIAKQKKVEVKVDVSEKMPLISADTSLLSRAMVNLLDNAMKYTNSGGTVRMKSEVDSSHVVISLKNTGEGIDRDDLPHVFDRYYKAPSQKPHQSTGLGLAIARHIILLHGGEITVSSVKGIETDFTIRLPFA